MGRSTLSVQEAVACAKVVSACSLSRIGSNVVAALVGEPAALHSRAMRPILSASTARVSSRQRTICAYPYYTTTFHRLLEMMDLQYSPQFLVPIATFGMVYAAPYG